MIGKRPLVLLGDLAPIARLGLAQVLADHGARTVDGDRHPDRLVAQALELRPDAVVLGLGRADEHALAVRVTAAAPGAKVILWPRDEDRMEVLAAGARARWEPARPDALLNELRAGG
jgi:DNA-binding NarL/FixJ family response regulator